MDLLILIGLIVSALVLFGIKQFWLSLVLSVAGTFLFWVMILTGAGHPPFGALTPWEYVEVHLVAFACFMVVWGLRTMLRRVSKHHKA